MTWELYTEIFLKFIELAELKSIQAYVEKKKRMVKKNQFPKDCQNAFDMGVRFAKQAHI